MNKVLTAQNRICAGNRPANGGILPVRKGVGVGMPAGMNVVLLSPIHWEQRGSRINYEGQIRWSNPEKMGVKEDAGVPIPGEIGDIKCLDY